MNIMSMSFICALTALSSLIIGVHSACSWSVPTGAGGTATLDLSCLNLESLSTTDNSGHSYEWSVCTDDKSCDGSAAMVAQSNSDGSNCYILGRWDATILPQYSDQNGGTWEFQYANGDDDCGSPARTWAPKFICDPNVETEVDAVRETGNSCYYTVNIATKYACTATPISCATDASGALSGGSVFLIILVSALFLYCIVGYIVMGLIVNKEGGLGDFSNNIPNKGFWTVFPSLVVAGCSVTKEAVMGLLRKNDGAQDALIEDED